MRPKIVTKPLFYIFRSFGKNYSIEKKISRKFPRNSKNFPGNEIYRNFLGFPGRDFPAGINPSFCILKIKIVNSVSVPHTNNTIPEMIRHVDSQKIVVTGQGRYGIKVPPNQPKITSAYSFQNAFFYLQFPDDSEASQTNLRVLRKTRKKSKFNPQKQRSKYICVPQNVKEAGNHFIWEFHRGSSLNVPTKFGFLHHYRVCEFGGDNKI